MQEDKRHALGIARLFPIHLVPAVEIQHAAVEGFDFRIKVDVAHALLLRNFAAAALSGATKAS